MSEKIFAALNGPASTTLEIKCGTNLYIHCCEYLAKFGTNTRSFSAELRGRRQDDDSGDDDGKEEHKQEEAALTLGLGLHEIEHESHTITVVHQCVGVPVGTMICGSVLRTALVLFVHGVDKGAV